MIYQCEQAVHYLHRLVHLISIIAYSLNIHIHMYVYFVLYQVRKQNIQQCVY